MVELKPVAQINQREKEAFEANVAYLDSCGIYERFYEEAKRNEGLNDDTLWHFNDRNFSDLHRVRVTLIKKQRVENGRTDKKVSFKYNGEWLVICGQQKEGNFKLPRGGVVAPEMMGKIEAAFKKAFEKPEISFISKKDLLSSD